VSDIQQGWYEDPWGRHEARYFSAGRPTDLVLDGTVEGHDPPPDEIPDVFPPAPVGREDTTAPLRKRSHRSIPGFVLYVGCFLLLVAIAFGWRVLVPEPDTSVLAGLDINCAAHASTAVHLSSAPIVIDNDVPVAGLCIDGKGPYPFEVASGASLTVMSGDLASRLHLHHTGDPIRIGTMGSNSSRCAANAWPTQLATWSAATLSLPSDQTVYVGPVHSLPDGIDGLLGSDVLSQFGAVRIDYGSSRLLVAGTKAAPSLTVPGLDGVALHLPRELVHGTYHLSSPATTVHSSLTGAALLTEVSVNGHQEPFRVDTGASKSAIASAVEQQIADEGPIESGKPQTLDGPFCSYTDQVIENLNVQVGGSTVQHEPLLMATGSETGVQGILGSDILRDAKGSEPWVLLDYRDGYLLVGSK
jgi:hypothetical protein